MYLIILKRPAIAMIELIFAIVIMGIVLMSAPMLLSEASKSGLVVVQQEAIAAASSELGMILTRHWDEQDTNESLESPILVTAGDAELQEARYADGSLSGRRAGTPLSSARTFLTSLGGRLNSTAPASLGADAGDRDDIDDFNGVTITLNNIDPTSTQSGDYADKSLQLVPTVNYVSDTPSSGSYNGSQLSLNTPITTAAPGTSNIKRVSITVTSGSNSNVLNTNITLHAFSCNIGTYELEERRF